LLVRAAGKNEVEQLWEQLRSKDAQILMLQKKLQHMRSWVNSIHSKVQGMSPQIIKNARRLYLGGVPPEATDVSCLLFDESLASI
jgi:hypothetical protein